MCYIKKNKNGEMEVKLSLYLFEEDGQMHVYSPSLDLVGCGKTEKLALKSFLIVFKEYIRYTVENNTLKQDLEEHGWQVSGGYKSPSVEKMLKSNKELANIFKKPSYKKMEMPYCYSRV